MSSELKKRFITSFFLLILFYLMINYSYILIISLIIISIIIWIEFNLLVSKIIKKKTFKEKLLRYSLKIISLIYLSLLVFLILNIESHNTHLKIFFIYSILVSIVSDIGGLFIGKMFKGRKLTKISPKKTVSGSIGSFLFSMILVPIFSNFFLQFDVFYLILITLLISFISQLGDIFISFLKRKAKVKDTSDLLPGHGGVLDRVDGIIFALPTGLLLFSIF